MRVLLVQPPFWAVNSPSLGLSYLRAAVQDAGMVADICYANLDFAELIGRDLYLAIKSQLPVDLLFGDLVFGPALHGNRMTLEDIPALLRSMLTGGLVHRSVPGEIIDSYGVLTEQAIRYIESFGVSASWKGYDLVGFSTTFSLVPALAMAKVVKQAGDSPPIVFGGCHCDGPLGEALLRHFPWIDYIVRGDGENSLVDLACHLSLGKPDRRDIDGLLWREAPGIGSARVERARQEDLDDLPHAEFGDWFTALEKYGWKNASELRLPFETSRGCWYGQRRPCLFCGLNGAGMAFRSKGANRLLGEYASLLKLGVPAINAVDSILDPAFFREVIPGIEAMPGKATMFFEVRPTLSLSQLRSLQRAGIRLLQPGIESLSSRLLRLMNKGTTAFQNVRLLKWSAELGLPLSWNLLYGFPGESSKDYLEMGDLLPAIEHLLPPVTDCNKIHVDRFSPLFDQHRDAIQPIAPYALALGVGQAEANELAYHFEFRESPSGDPAVGLAVEQLRLGVAAWQESLGTAVLAALNRGDSYWLCDTRRSDAGHTGRIGDLEGRAMRMMGNGCTREALCVRLGAPMKTVDELVDRFLERRWVVELDGKCLALAINMDDVVPTAVPDSMLEEVVVTLYSHRMRKMWEAVAG